MRRTIEELLAPQLLTPLVPPAQAFLWCMATVTAAVTVRMWTEILFPRRMPAETPADLAAAYRRGLVNGAQQLAAPAPLLRVVPKPGA